MISEHATETLDFSLKNIALLRFDSDSVYEDIISPFTRIYLITKGNGMLSIGNRKIELEAGFLYLIPRYTSCTYLFNQGLEHYYIHLRIDLSNGLSPYQLYSVKNKVRAQELDYSLFGRILELNPNLQLPHHHPNVYQNKEWMNKKAAYLSVSQLLETNGILKQLFSRFVEEKPHFYSSGLIKYNIQPILLYIQQHLEDEIKIELLASIACLSKDHFSKVFKTITGTSPGDYIIAKRIERCQFLLLTTDLTLKQISEKTGFRNITYFSRLFKQHTTYTPNLYRKQRG